MGINSLTRVIWRIRQNTPKTGENTPKVGETLPFSAKTRQKVTVFELKKAIIKECGYSEGTYYRVKRSLIILGWLKTHKKYMILTGKDLEET